MDSTRSRRRPRRPRIPDRDLAIGIVGSMVLCVIIYMAVAAVAIGALAYTRFADSPEPLALILREIGQGWAAKILGVSAVDRLAHCHPRLLLRPKPHLLRHGARRASSDQASRAFRARGTPVRITLFTAVIVVSSIAGFFPLADDRRARKRRNSDGLHRRLRGYARHAPAGARSRRVVSRRRFRGWWALVAILGCAYLFCSLPVKTQTYFLLWNAAGLVLYWVLRFRARREARAGVGG